MDAVAKALAQLIRACFLITGSGSTWGCSSPPCRQSQALGAGRGCWCVPGSHLAKPDRQLCWFRRNTLKVRKPEGKKTELKAQIRSGSQHYWSCSLEFLNVEPSGHPLGWGDYSTSLVRSWFSFPLERNDTTITVQMRCPSDILCTLSQSVQNVVPGRQSPCHQPRKSWLQFRCWICRLRSVSGTRNFPDVWDPAAASRLVLSTVEEEEV